MRVAAGAIARKFLKEKLNLDIVGYLSQIGKLKINEVDFNEIPNNPFFCPDKGLIKEIELLIDDLRKEGDSVGAQISIAVKNMPLGLGEPVFDKLDACLLYTSPSPRDS